MLHKLSRLFDLIFSIFLMLYITQRLYYSINLTLQRLKHVGFLYTFTSKYTRKHMRLMSFYKTFTTKDAIASISDSIRLVSEPIYIYSLFKLRYCLNSSCQLICLLPNYEAYRSFQILHYIYQYQSFLNHHLYSLSGKHCTYLFVS